MRRFYPAASEPARVPGLRLPIAAPPLGGASVAVLDSGVDPGHPLLAGRLDPGYDAVDRDDDPAPVTDPRGGRRETSGTALAGILVAAGERVLPIRVAGLQPATRGAGLEDVATSDQLLAGLERAVDPDGDGATDDHVPVAVVGVNSPYAAFERSPEARAVRSAAAARHARRRAQRRARARPPGRRAPSARRQRRRTRSRSGALAVPEGVPHVELQVGGADARGAVLLAGFPPPGGLKTAGPVESTDPAELLAGDAGSLRGRLVVVRAGDEPVARAAAAAAAGARAVLLADPRRRPLPAIPAGRIAAPVLGVTGEAAAAVLEEDAGAEVEVGDVEPGRPPAATLPPDSGGGAAESSSGAALSPFSSRGPAAGGGIAPALAAPGAALTAVPGDASAVVGGSAIAAARTAVEAARLVRERPGRHAARAARGAGRRRRPRPAAAGPRGGSRALRRPAVPAAVTARTTPERRADPCPGTAACVRIVLANKGAVGRRPDALRRRRPRHARRRSPARRSRSRPAGRREAEVDVAGAGPDGLAAGRLVVRAAGGSAVLAHPFAIATAPPEPPPLGPLSVQRDGDRVTGVRFPLGAFERGDPLGGGPASR